MSMLFQVLMSALAAICFAYIGFCFFRMLKTPAIQREFKELSRQSTEAARENNALLRDLIDINKKLLDKLNEPKS